MRQYKVVWTESAVQDLEEIFTHIAFDSPTNARRILTRLREKTQRLRTLPKRGRVVPELLDLGIQSWRELVIPPHRIVYRIDEQRVFIQVIFDSRRDAEALLLGRLMRP